MSVKIQVISVEKKEGVSKESGKSYSMQILQMIVHGSGDQPIIGKFIPPKDHPVVTPGFYSAELDIGVVDFNRMTLGGVIRRLIPAPASKPV